MAISLILSSVMQRITGTIFRALREVRARNPGDAITKFIDSYVYTQLNAILAVSSSGGIYANSWNGQPVSSVDVDGSISAIDALNYGFSIVANISSTSSNSSSPSSLAPPSSPSFRPPSPASHIGAIIGGSVGGVVVLAAITLSVFLYLRRKRRPRNADIYIADNPEMNQVVSRRLVDEHPSVAPYPHEIRPHTGTGGKLAFEQARARYDNPESLGTGQTSVLLPSSTTASDMGRSVDHRQVERGQGDAQVYGLWSDLARRLETLITATELNRQSVHAQPPSYEGVSREDASRNGSR